mgnify:CR=1 FL=1
MKLVIAEKPSVAMSLAAVLGANEKKDGYLEGGGYLVSWCIGHLLELAQPEAYGNSMPDGVTLTCLSCRKHGNMRSQRIKRNSLPFCAG